MPDRFRLISAEATAVVSACNLQWQEKCRMSFNPLTSKCVYANRPWLSRRLVAAERERVHALSVHFDGSKLH